MRTRAKHDQEFMKLQNKIMVLEIIRRNRPVSRADISKISGMSATSIGRIVNDLVGLGLVRETNTYTSGIGRRAHLLDVDGENIRTVGVELDKNLTRLMIIDFDGNTKASADVVQKDHSPQSVLGTVVDEIRKLTSSATIHESKIVGIGVGIPGIVDNSRGVVVFSTQFGWKNIEFARLLEESLKIPVYVDNDLKVKALAESRFGEVMFSGRTVLIGIGSGVGSALIIDGEIYRGVDNIAGEIGHFTIDPSGMLCECGKRGCIQTYILSSTILREANMVRDVPTISSFLDFYEQGQPWAIDILDRVCTYVAITVSNIVCMYNPETVILGGDYIQQHPRILELVRIKLKDFIWEPFRDTFRIVTPKLHKHSVVIGAATLAMESRLKFELQGE